MNNISKVGSLAGNDIGKARVAVSVIIPTLNEEKNLPLILPFLPMNDIHEVILVDGRSTDDTVEVARRLLPSIKIILETRPGKGMALRRGYQEATGEIIVVLDGDGSNDPREIPRFVNALLEGADFVKGSRFAPQGGTTDMPRFRKLGNWGLMTLANILFGSSFTDLCYGYHGFWRYCLDEIDLSDIDGFEVDTAIYLRALKQHLRIVDVPSFEGYRFYGVGKLQTFPDGWRVLRTIFGEFIDGLRLPEPKVYLGFRGISPNNQLISSGQSMKVLDNYPSHQLSTKEGIENFRVSLEILYSLSCSLPEGQYLSNLLQLILKYSLNSIEAQSGSIALLNSDGRLVEGYSAFQGEVHSLNNSHLAEAIDQGLARWVLDHRQPALVQSTRSDPRWWMQSWEKHNQEGRSALGIPLISCDRIIGVLTLVRNEDYRFTDDDLNLVMRATNLIEQPTGSLQG